LKNNESSSQEIVYPIISGISEIQASHPEIASTYLKKTLPVSQKMTSQGASPIQETCPLLASTRPTVKFEKLKLPLLGGTKDFFSIQVAP
jgi:hypothetical protein